MKRNTIVIIVVVILVCITVGVAFYLKNNNDEPESSEDPVEQVKQETLNNEAMLKGQAKKVFMDEELKDIDTEIKIREEIVLSQGGNLDESAELKQLKIDRAKIYKEAEELFDLMYIASESIDRDNLDTAIEQAEKERLEQIAIAQKQFDDLQSSLDGGVEPMDEDTVQELSTMELRTRTAAILEDLKENKPLEGEDPSPEYIVLRMDLQMLEMEKERRVNINLNNGFPEHWTPRPSIETKDIVTFPSEWGLKYGISGSSTKRNWISSNIERDKELGIIGPSPTNI
jgi:hypothetical protein